MSYSNSLTAPLRRFITVAGATIAASLLLAGTGEAHIELRPKQAPAGDTRTFSLVVENERADASTRALDLLLPQGVAVRTRDTARGWQVRVRGRRLSLTAPAGEEVGPGEKRSFPVTLSMPIRPGAQLTFKVIQEYDSNELVRWIGPPGSVEPAPRVTLTRAARGPEQDDTTSDPTQTSTAPPSGVTPGGDSDGNGLLIAGAVAGGAALLALGALALVRRRRRSPG